MKNLSFLFCLLVLFSCKQNRKDSLLEEVPSLATDNIGKPAMTYREFYGKTMGTTYAIKYMAPRSQTDVSKKIVDSILVSINDAVSTYVPTSTISRFNLAGKEGIKAKSNDYPDQHFIANYFSSLDIFKKTEGYFDPSVMPLVNYWGFGYEGKNPVTQVDSSKIKNLLESVGMEKFSVQVSREGIGFNKINPKSTLDFSAIAKGYAVDYLANHLKSQNIFSYMIEIGGEVKVSGKNKNGDYWKLGVNTPEENADPRDIQLIVAPQDKALASSGNYRIFHKVEDISYGHEINPKTGFPHVTDILSASVIHDNCTQADAYATAFMIMGLEKTLEFVNYNHDIEVCLIVKENGKLKNIFSKGFEQYVVN